MSSMSAYLTARSLLEVDVGTTVTVWDIAELNSIWFESDCWLDMGLSFWVIVVDNGRVIVVCIGIEAIGSFIGVAMGKVMGVCKWVVIGAVVKVVRVVDEDIVVNGVNTHDIPMLLFIFAGDERASVVSVASVLPSSIFFIPEYLMRGCDFVAISIWYDGFIFVDELHMLLNVPILLNDTGIIIFCEPIGSSFLAIVVIGVGLDNVTCGTDWGRLDFPKKKNRNKNNEN